MKAFLVLTGEALRDAARRRIVAVIAVASLLSLMLVESCTSCGPGRLLVNGEVREMVNVSGFTGSATFVLLGLWCILLAGVLAAEHLAQSLSDGSATLCLARPVGRGTFATARLAGALGIAFATAAVLLGGTTFFLNARSDLPVGPALPGALVVATGCVILGSLAMAASLFMPRIASAVLALVAVGTVTLANAVGFFSDEATGFLALVDRFGPPLCTALAVAVDPWLTQVAVPGDPLELALRLGLWAAGSVALLWLAFRHIDLGG